MMKMTCSLFLAALAVAICAGCPPRGPVPSPDDAGAGGGTASASTTSTSSSGAGGAAPVPACIEPRPRVRPDGWRCSRATDCYDGSPCTEDACMEDGRCRNVVREGGCDLGALDGVCRAGACCPRDGSTAQPISRPQ